jgi:hypothetical protein
LLHSEQRNLPLSLIISIPIIADLILQPVLPVIGSSPCRQGIRILTMQDRPIQNRACNFSLE